MNKIFLLILIYTIIKMLDVNISRSFYLFFCFLDSIPDTIYLILYLRIFKKNVELRYNDI